MNRSSMIAGLAIAASAAVVLAAAVLQPFDRTEIALRRPQGLTEQGTLLGVRVGMEQSAATSVLGRTDLVQSYDGRPIVSNCGGDGVILAEHLTVWNDHSWRNGTVCVFSRQGIVSGISWHFAPFYPPNF